MSLMISDSLSTAGSNSNNSRLLAIWSNDASKGSPFYHDRLFNRYLVLFLAIFNDTEYHPNKHDETNHENNLTGELIPAAPHRFSINLDHGQLIVSASNTNDILVSSNKMIERLSKNSPFETIKSGKDKQYHPFLSVLSVCPHT